MKQSYLWGGLFAFVLALLASPAFGQTKGVFTEHDDYRIRGDDLVRTGDGDSLYVHDDNYCSIVEINRHGSFFLRTRSKYASAADCSDGHGRSMIIDFVCGQESCPDLPQFPDFPDEPGLFYGPNELDDVMLRAKGMFDEPRKKGDGTVKAEVYLTFSEKQQGEIWYELKFYYGIQVDPVEGSVCGAKRITVGLDNPATLIVKVDPTAEKRRGKPKPVDPIGVFLMPFELTVYPKDCDFQQ